VNATRHLLVLALLPALAACDCGPPSHGVDGGVEAGADAGRDGGRDAVRTDAPRDAARDAGRDAAWPDAAGLLPFPDGWERVPFLPEGCYAWRPRGEASSVVPPIRFAPCDPPEPGCEDLVTDWPRDRNNRNLVVPLGKMIGGQTWGDTDLVAFGVPFSIRDFSGALYTWGIYRLDGAPVAAWRIKPPWASWPEQCSVNTIAVVGDRVAVGFEREAPGWPLEVVVLADRIDAIQHQDRPIVRFGLDDIASVGNLPDELLWDGDSVILHGHAGAVYIGSMAGAPVGNIATARTGDVMNVGGMLWEGAFYWAGSPFEMPGWARVRRRRPGSTTNETIMVADDRDMSCLRTDGTWVTWIENLDTSPLDGRQDHTQVLAARSGGSMDPSRWMPSRIVSRPRYPSRITGFRPVLTGGMLGYVLRYTDMELVDLERMERLHIEVPWRGGWLWSILHLGPEWLYVLVSHGYAPFDGVRRYRIADLEGWVPVE